MLDPRIEKLARVLVHYSLQIRRNDLFRIAGPSLATPLIRAVYTEGLAAGANPYVRISLEGLEEVFYRHATDEQLRFVSELDRAEIEQVNATLGIGGRWNTRDLTGVQPQRLASRREAMSGLQRRFLERAAKHELRWCGTQYPTHAEAQDAEMSLAEYEDFVFTAGLLHEDDPVAAWERVRAEQSRIATFLGRCTTMSFRGPDIDLTVSVAGRTWINAAGEKNFPDGEVFTGPVEDSASGRVRFSFPAIFQGREVEGVELTFERGKVAQARAAKGEDFLRAMLDTDPGARYLGELAFGLNYGIPKFTRNILFDEKIGGTMHMALGIGYPETGSKNTSGLHWDMICDLRADSEVKADGQAIYRNGRFLI
jgi:aminopeptidase